MGPSLGVYKTSTHMLSNFIMATTEQQLLYLSQVPKEKKRWTERVQVMSSVKRGKWKKPIMWEQDEIHIDLHVVWVNKL